MKNFKKIVLAAEIILVAIVSFFIGRLTVPTDNTTTFYATIENVNEKSFRVKGLEVNDINSRGNFKFTVDESTILEWRHTEITLEDLQVGDIISVTYIGAVQETEPAGIDKVLKVQLLDDEK